MVAAMLVGMVAWMRHRRPRSQLDQPAAVARLLPSTHSHGSTSRTARPTRPAWRAWADAVQPRRAAVPGRCPAPSRPAHQARSA
jgi:hypothetical protein